MKRFEDLQASDDERQLGDGRAITKINAESPQPPGLELEGDDSLVDTSQIKHRPSRRRAQPARFSEQPSSARPSREREMTGNAQPQSRRSTRRSADMNGGRKGKSSEESRQPHEASPDEGQQKGGTIKVCHCSIKICLPLLVPNASTLVELEEG